MQWPVTVLSFTSGSSANRNFPFGRTASRMSVSCSSLKTEFWESSQPENRKLPKIRLCRRSRNAFEAPVLDCASNYGHCISSALRSERDPRRTRAKAVYGLPPSGDKETARILPVDDIWVRCPVILAVLWGNGPSSHLRLSQLQLTWEIWSSGQRTPVRKRV